MVFDPEAKLSDVLAGGYHLTTKLIAVLGRPLDSRSQEEAIAFSQELSRVFVVSMSMLKQPDDSKRTLKMSPEIRNGDSFRVCALAKDKLIRNGSRESVTSHKKNMREAEFTRKEITSEPHKDGFQWQKYGQKNIQNCSFMRYYFRCHDRRCDARKKVQQQEQQQDEGDAPPMFEVTYLNDHTCHHVAALANDVPNSKSLPTTTTTGQASLQTAANTGGALFHLLQEENEAIVSCLATVISGTAPSSPGGDPPANMPQLLQLPDMEDGAMTAMMGTDGISWEDPSSFWPAEVDDVMDLCDVDVHMDAARFVGTVWPQYYT